MMVIIMTTKSILITGASTGIGYCVAHGLKKRGYRVFATARKAEDVERLKQEGLESFTLDLDDNISILNAMKRILHETGGTLDALFNNGAYGQPGAVEDLTTDTLMKQFRSNFFGWHELTRLVIPVMRKQGHGHIIQNSSVLGFAAMRYRGAYNASKYAIEGLTDTLRLELHGTGIHVVLIEPGPIESRFRENAYRAFIDNIDRENSVHRELYAETEERLRAEESNTPFTLPAEAVLAKVIKALESKRPQPRYYVTFPTYVFGYLKRALPTRWLDKLLLRIT